MTTAASGSDPVLCNTRPAVPVDRRPAARTRITGAVKPGGATEQQIHPVHSVGRQTLSAWRTPDTGGPSTVAGVPDESTATVNVGCRTLEIAALMELQSAAVATTAPRRRSRYTYRSWGPNRRGELMEADTLRDVRPPSALSSSPPFPLSPLPFLPSPW
jgi:hypothetical protein|eukprot:SAG25_NODE_84_length_16553_cov_5.346238_17_plen_159_part_00